MVSPPFVTLFVLIILFLCRYHVKKIIEMKDNEIERLAEDNRRYREVYLTNIKGLASDQYRQISGESILPGKREDYQIQTKRKKK